MCISHFMVMWLSINNTIMFSKMKHPMSMGAILLIQTVMICMMVTSVAKNAWFSYILFLVFLGGVLVLFVYMTSVASYELFQKEALTSIMIMWTMLMSMVAILVMDPITLLNNTGDTMMTSSNEMSSPQPTSMFNYPNNILTIMAVIYLFLTLIVVVKITESHQGPLRMMN